MKYMVTYKRIFNFTHAAPCSDGDLKLVGGATKFEGRLEVCFEKRWGTIHGIGWGQTETEVACKQLGHSTSSMYMYACKTCLFKR